MKIIDLRSDTITQPTEAMRLAMAHAVVGDDVLGDDPTVAALEQETARILGTQAALFLPSGTMANQVAVRTHTAPGDEVLLESNSHIYYYEAGGIAALSGVMPRCIDGHRGIFTASQLRTLLRPADVHFAPTRLLCVENTHNRGGGSVWSLAQVQEVCQFAQSHQIARHLDGARLWNASIASGVPESEFASCFDSVSVCFSKGLGAPIGSCLAGSTDFIQRARRFRKQLGGGMRQAGIVAAGALHALRFHRERLATDHANARLLAESLQQIPGIQINPAEVETNLVRFDIGGSASQAAQRLAEAGVRVLATGPSTLRAVTSLMVDRADIETAISIAQQVLAKPCP